MELVHSVTMCFIHHHCHVFDSYWGTWISFFEYACVTHSIIHHSRIFSTPHLFHCKAVYVVSLQLCGVSILRAGETMEPALESVVKDIRIGKILIQTNEYTSEPEVGLSFMIK